MADENWAKLREVFDSALRRKPAERRKFVIEVCGGDRVLLAEVESLLDSLDSAESFMETPAVAKVANEIEVEQKKLETGKCFGHYEIIRQIGAGGMGEVYLANDQKLDRQVAVKILNEKFSRDESNLHRFIQEAKVASVLNHPNILVIHEIGETEDAHFIVSEFIKGETLRGILKDKSLSVAEILDIAIQIANALVAAHEAHLIHRDIKPENIMIRPDGFVKVLDFGLAKLVQSKKESVGLESATAKQNETAKGVIMGTVNYMSPEQAKGAEVDEHTDIFSFGVVLYEMIAGRTPFAGDSVAETYANLINAAPPPLSHFAEDVPSKLQQIVSKTLGKNTDARYQTMTELLADLKNLRENLTFDKKLERSASPVASCSLFGRTREISAIENLLRHEDVRLVTLTGAGGTGKTVLAQTVADGCLAEFPDGVFLVELAAVTNPDWVVSAIANILDVKETIGKSLIETLKTFLRQRRILLVLDNFEQIVVAAPLLAELLEASLHLKILVTSRVVLHLSAENEVVVPPLAVPPEEFRAISADKLHEYSSVELFVERARNVKPNFVLADENASAIAEICLKLDGLPLAIELAAARIKLLSPQALLQRLENRLQLLTSQTKDLPVRQKTMRDTIAWSYDLLSAKEKTIFKQLAVFAGGFTVEAAEAICQAADSTEILDVLESLVGNNLLRQTDESTGETRLLMLETIREYSAEQLTESVEEAAMRQRHADFFLNYAKRMERGLLGANQADLLNQMEAERDNFRVALDWNQKNGDDNQLKLAAALTMFWTLHGYLSEGIERLSVALQNYPKVAAKTRAKGLAALGQMVWMQSDYVRAIALCEESLALARQINYPMISAHSLFVLGMSYWYQHGDAPRSIACLEESLALYRELGYDTGIVFALVVLAAIYQPTDLPRMAELLDESLAVARQTGNNLALSIVLVNYGRLKFAEGDFGRAKDLCRESLRLRGEIADKWGIVQCLEPLAAIAVMDDEPRRAAKIFGAIDVLLESVGAQPPLIFRADHEPNLAAARAALDEATFAALFAAGRKLRTHEIVYLALDESTDERHDSDFSDAETHFSRLWTDETFPAKNSEEVFAANRTATSSVYGFRFRAAVGLIGLLMAIGFGYWFFAYRSATIESVAVMPFVNVSADSEVEYLSDGISESLIDRLAQLPQLKVIARSSSFKYRGENIDLQDAAQKLGVQAIITGRVVRHGDNLFIRVEMVDARDNRQLWSEQYNRRTADILMIQQEIANTVSEKLRVKLSGGQEQAIIKQPTVNPQAYELLLKGHYYRNKNGTENKKKAAEFYQKAIEVDAGYAAAYSALSVIYSDLTQNSILDPKEFKPKAESAARMALALDENLAEAHDALALLKLNDWDWTTAGQEYRRAIELNPNFAKAHSSYGFYLSLVGQHEQAVAEFYRAKEINPLSPSVNASIGYGLYLARRYDEALEVLQNALEMDRDNAFTNGIIAHCYLGKGMYPEAIIAFRRVIELGGEPGYRIYLGAAYAKAGEREQAQTILRQLENGEDYISPGELAVLYAALGDYDKTFAAFDRAYDAHDAQLQFLMVEPAFDALRSDSRFQDLLRRVGLAQ